MDDARTLAKLTVDKRAEGGLSRALALWNNRVKIRAALHDLASLLESLGPCNCDSVGGCYRHDEPPPCRVGALRKKWLPAPEVKP